MSLFETGPVLTTPGIREIMNHGSQAIDTIQKCLDRHCQGDWGGAPETGHKHCQVWHWITTNIQLPICLT